MIDKIISEKDFLFDNKLQLYLLLAVLFIFKTAFILTCGKVVYFDGEQYFGFSQQIYHALIELNFEKLFSTPVRGHWGAILWGVIPFILSFGFLPTEILSAVFFMLPTLVNIYLLYVIAERMALGQKAALIAAFLYAFSFSSFYFIRHAHPSDFALMFFLLSVLLTLKFDGRVYKYIFLSGLCCGLCFFTYYGYWTMALLGMIFTTFYQSSTVKTVFYKGLLASASFFLPLIVFYCVSEYFGGDFIHHLIYFSGTIKEGDPQEGFIIPFEFLFYAEDVLFFVWLLCFLIACYGFFRGSLPGALKTVCLGVVFLYVILVLGSNVLEKFAVYGRVAKQLVPMLCLLAGFVLASQVKSALHRKILAGLSVLIVGSFLSKSYALHTVLFEVEFDELFAQYRQQELPPGREIHTVDVCESDYIDCPNFESCNVLVSTRNAEQLRFFWFDELIHPKVRQHLKRSTFYRQIVNCPVGIVN